METIVVYIENLIKMCGLSGNTVIWVRHAVMITLVLVLAWLADRLCRRIFIPIVEKITRRTSAKWDDVLFGRPVLSAACSIIPALVVWKLLPIVFYEHPVVEEIFNRLTAIYATIATVNLIVTFIKSMKNMRTDSGSNVHQYIVSFCGLLQVIVIFIAVIIIIAIIINRRPFTLLAGLGATSAILMLVFKDTIEGLVAGIRLTSADMLHVGDWITVPSTNADGNVIEMSLTTVKVQNFDNTIVTVSPTTLVNGSFQNWKGMQVAGGRRVNRIILFDIRSIKFVDEKRQETNMTRYRQKMEDYLRNNAEVNNQMTLMVRQKEATASGLPMEMYFFLKDKVWVHYEHNLANIMEYAYALAGEYGLKVYQHFPEQ
ncbi:MAG: mechanosensitive ion channel family protein [Prevotella sp.]|jgi:miniconductance mechanosensitive channel